MAWVDDDVAPTPLGAEGESVEELEPLEVPELVELLELLEDEPEDELELLPPPWCPWWSGSMYCEFPAELPPPPPASAVVLAARPNAITARKQRNIRVESRIRRYSSSAARLRAPRPENQAAEPDFREPRSRGGLGARRDPTRNEHLTGWRGSRRCPAASRRPKKPFLRPGATTASPCRCGPDDDDQGLRDCGGGPA